MDNQSVKQFHSRIGRINLATSARRHRVSPSKLDSIDSNSPLCWAHRRWALIFGGWRVALIKALALALVLVVSTPPVYAGSAGEALAKNGFSKKAQDAADEVQASLKKMLANHDSKSLGIGANLVDRLNNADDICKLAATELPRLMKFLLISDPLTNETALEYHRLRLNFEILQKECHDRKAALNTTLADQVKEHAAGKNPKTEPESEDDIEEGGDNEPQIPDSERPEFDGWSSSDFACRSACDKHYEAYKAEIDWHNLEIESMNKALNEYYRLNDVIESLEEEVETRRANRNNLSGGAKRLNDIRIADANKKIISTKALKKNALEISNRKRDAAKSHLDKAGKHWQALIECIKECYEIASAIGESRPDNARGFYSPYRHDPEPRRRSDYEEGTRVPTIGSKETTDTSKNVGGEKALAVPGDGLKTTAGTGQQQIGKDSTDDQKERESFGMLQDERLVDFGALSRTVLVPGVSTTITAGASANVVSAIITVSDPGLNLAIGSYLNVFIELDADGGFSSNDTMAGEAHVLRNYPADQISVIGGKITLPEIDFGVGDSRPDFSTLRVFVSATPISLTGDVESSQIEFVEVHESTIVWPWSEGQIGGVAKMDCPDRVDFNGNLEASFVCDITSTGTAPIWVDYSMSRVRGDAYVDGTSSLSESIELLPNESAPLEFSVSKGDVRTSTWTYRATTGATQFVDNIAETMLHVKDSTGDIVIVDDNLGDIGLNAGLDGTGVQLEEIVIDPVLAAPTNVQIERLTEPDITTQLLR